MVADRTGYQNNNQRISTKNLTENQPLIKDLFLVPIINDRPIKLDNIYYDFDKFNIRKDAVGDLEKLVQILKQNPTMWIELGSHTDSRGNDQYNKWLSQHRADAVVRYIVGRGIDESRIVAKGYGESELINDCVNGAKCTLEEHQENRRTEFKIIKQ